MTTSSNTIRLLATFADGTKEYFDYDEMKNKMIKPVTSLIWTISELHQEIDPPHQVYIVDPNPISSNTITFENKIMSNDPLYYANFTPYKSK